ncbi:AMP-dependent synthetase/ligase [Penicillium digitatum]|uniref:AMP-dependent synthetase/ligase n=1 Tax=Penicillium digitatum TaxID=36651 RepID=A0A7T6XUD2_PENDI|nr:AMP-dependent synthetase/ligase [Penicillium digitatum]
MAQNAFVAATLMLESPLTFRIPELLPGPLVVIALATHPAATDYDLSNVELVGRCCAVEGVVHPVNRHRACQGDHLIHQDLDNADWTSDEPQGKVDD